jgi:anti-anti-sigma factor
MDRTEILVLTGELDRAQADTVASAFGSAVARVGRGQALLLDMAGVTFADSTILALLYDLIGSLPERGWVGLIGPSPGMMRILSLGGLTEHRSVRMFASHEDARVALAPAYQGKDG